MKYLFPVVSVVGLLMMQGCVAGSGSEETTAEEQAALNSTCLSKQGINATKAALAVAMGIELGRWDPTNDLVKVGNTNVALKAGVTCVKNNCANTKAILGQQYFTVDQNNFSATSYASDLWSSFDRETNLLANLKANKPANLPPAHKLTLVGGPVNLGTGACGNHFIFQVDNTNGTALTSAQAANMSNTLCYYGQDAPGVSCGANPFVGFTQTQVNCPSGRMCVAIDPTDGDNGSTGTTTAGSAPTYPMNRVYDPANALLNTACVTTAGKVGTMQSKCTATPSTCGYLYCIAP